MKKAIWYALGWVFVRPRRWLFRGMVFNYELRLLPSYEKWRGWEWRFNLHWFVLYWTVFVFFKWLHWDAWRHLCTWGDRYLEHKPWYAALIQRIGQTTAGCSISGGECYHCAAVDGDPVSLADEDLHADGAHFRLLRSGSCATQDGTDYWFEGITTCPRCGYEDHYSDSSL